MQSWIKVLITTFALGGSVQSFAEATVRKNTCFKKTRAEIHEEYNISVLNTIYEHHPALLEYAAQKLSSYTYSTYSSVKKNLPSAIADSVTYEGGLGAVLYLVGAMNPYAALIMTSTSVLKYGVRYMCFDFIESQGYGDHKTICYMIGGPSGYGLSSYLKNRNLELLELKTKENYAYSTLKGVINNGMYGLFREGLNTHCLDASNKGQLRCAAYFAFIEGTEGFVDAISNSASFTSFEAIKNAVFGHTSDIKGGVGTGLVVYFVGENFFVPRFSESLKEGIAYVIQTVEDIVMYPLRSGSSHIDLTNDSPTAEQVEL